MDFNDTDIKQELSEHIECEVSFKRITNVGTKDQLSYYMIRKSVYRPNCESNYVQKDVSMPTGREVA